MSTYVGGIDALPENLQRLAAEARVFADAVVGSKAVMVVAHDAFQIRGSYRFMNENAVSRHLLDAKVPEVGEGFNGIAV